MSAEFEKEVRNALLPLWLQFPDMPRYSIGWRMDGGEDYCYKFSDWWAALSPEARQLYQQRYPEPIGWRGWYSDEDLAEEEGGNNPA